ncbi:hypothetical protein GGI07_004618 [Coemansia sp. Benny D115]|nr:hypothetical protein GGI07_004618 [Coemansia sp. Benny D115]
MAALSGQELDDSIFGTDSNLDWADEVNMTQPLNAEPFSNSAKPVKQKEYSEDPGSDPRRPSPTHPGSSTAKSHRDSADQRPARHQQPSGRQSRQDGRSSRNNRSESSSAYNNRAHSTTRASNSNASTTGTGGGGSRHRGGRSTSRSGYPPQGNFSHQPTGDQRPQQRAARDRSLSMERSGSIDRSRGWRGSTSSNRSRADRAERWEHDKFDAHPPAGGRGSRSRARRGSVTQEMPAPISAEMERIGKEGISHVTINRRESNASSRGQTASSHEVQRRGGGPENSLDERAGGMDVPRYAKGAQQQGGASSLGSNSAHLMSPRSPALAGFSSTGEPYRAPHRRQSSTDSHPAPVSGGSQVAATSPTNPASVPARKTSPQPTQPVLKQKQIQPIMASDDDGSSAEVEWENFVANGGLEMPLDRITDDLLRQPKQPKAHPTPSSSSGTGSQRRPSLSSGLAVDNLDLLPPVGLIVKQPRRPLVRLDDDGDTSDSAAGNGDSGGSEADRRDRVVNTGMSSLVLDQVIEPRTRRPSIPAAERLCACAFCTFTSFGDSKLSANYAGETSIKCFESCRLKV